MVMESGKFSGREIEQQVNCWTHMDMADTVDNIFDLKIMLLLCAGAGASVRMNSVQMSKCKLYPIRPDVFPANIQDRHLI